MSAKKITQAPAAKPWPFSVGFPLSIRLQHDSIAICGANRGMGRPILCEVPKTEHAEKDARSIAVACSEHIDRYLGKPDAVTADLVAALEGMVEAFSRVPDRNIGCDFAHKYDNARTALAKAKGAAL